MSNTPKNDDLNQRVTERIQDQLLLIMPEEDIRRRVDSVIEDFFTSSRDSYDRRQPSVFARMVHEHIKNKVDELLKVIFDSPEWKISVDEQLQVKIGTALQKVLGVTPNVLADTVAAEVARTRAMSLAYLITNNLRQSGHVHWEIVQTIEQAVNNALSVQR